MLGSLCIFLHAGVEDYPILYIMKNECEIIGGKSYKIKGYSPYISVMSLRN